MTEREIDWKKVIIALTAVVLIFLAMKRLYGGRAAEKIDYYYPLGTGVTEIQSDLGRAGISYTYQSRFGLLGIDNVTHNLLGNHGTRVVYRFDKDSEILMEVTIYTVFDTSAVTEDEMLKYYRDSVATVRSLFGKPRFSKTIRSEAGKTVLYSWKDAFRKKPPKPWNLSAWDTKEGEISVSMYSDMLSISFTTEEFVLQLLKEEGLLR